MKKPTGRQTSTTRKKATALKSKASHSEAAQQYDLRLYVTGLTPNSTRAIVNLKSFCKTYLDGRYHLEVIDIYQQPKLAQTEQIIASPTLIKRLPLPLRRLVGDLSQEERILAGLHLSTATP